MNYTIEKSVKRKDKRGFLIDFLTRDELDEKDKIFGQAYCVTFESAKSIRGNHYHTKKKEWFVIVKGKVLVVLEDIKTHEKVEFVLNARSSTYEKIAIAENIAHAFQNITKNAILINYCNKPFDKKNPDTYNYKLL